MRRVLAIFGLAILGLFSALAAPLQPAHAAPPPGYGRAAQSFEQYALRQRILAQILLIATGYTNFVPMEHMTPRLFKALRDFEADNGFAADGILDKVEVDKLIAVAAPYLDLWSFRSIGYPDRPYAIWAPTGLGLVRSQTESGLHFRDPQGRLTVHLLSLTNTSARALYRGILVEAEREGTDVHYKPFVDREDWFVISATAADGRDRYYRYHQDGDRVTGFALEWNNAKGDIHAERIAVIMSGSLRAAMQDQMFVEPPSSEAQAETAPPQQPATLPVAPNPAPAPKTTFTAGSGFYVTEAGHFVTNAHVVTNCGTIRVTTDDGSTTNAQRIAVDTTNDLALLKLERLPARVATIRTATRLGEGVAAFGYPHSDILASAGNFTRGDVTALSGMHDDSRFLQISAPVQSGNSGGPLLDASGNLVGVVTAKLNAVKVMLASDDLPQNVNFAIKAGTLTGFLDANRVKYKTGAPGKSMDPADLADRAREMSGFVVCR